jgi:high-affinity nickel permease
MVGLLSIIALGFFLGMRHATDPDHVIAVTTIVTRQRSIARSAWIGTFWGLGHTLTILLVGAGIILFNLVIPARLGLSMELSVGLMLIILGLMNVVSFFRSVAELAPDDSADVLAHTHSHGLGGFAHTGHSHRSTHAPLAHMDRALGRLGVYQYIRPLIIGIVHGLAGSAAVALLVLTTIRDLRWAVGYLLVFGVGTIAGMTLITLSLASTLHWVGKRRLFSRRLALVSGLISVGFGLLVAYQTGIASGLLTNHPSWTPR